MMNRMCFIHSLSIINQFLMISRSLLYTSPPLSPKNGPEVPSKSKPNDLSMPPSLSASTPFHCIAQFDGLHMSWVNSMAFSPDGSMLASAGADGAIFIINTKTRLPILCLDFEHPQAPTCIIWPDIDNLVVGRSDGAVHIFTLGPAEVRTTLRPTQDAYAQIPFLPSGYRTYLSRGGPHSSCAYQVYGILWGRGKNACHCFPRHREDISRRYASFWFSLQNGLLHNTF